MPDDVSPASEAPVPRCPWCSAELAETDLTNCHTCGASLHAEGEPQVPGLTSIDPVAVLEGSKEPRRPRNRFLAWLSGDTPEAPAPGDRDALAPPDAAVRREMLRLQMEAELSARSADAEAIVSDQAVEAADEGDQAAAEAAVKAVRDADAATDELIESPEELQVAGSGPAEVGQVEASTPAVPDPAPAAPGPTAGA
jgi:hypothetical protein